MTDGQGRLVPKESVSEIDQTRDTIVRDLVEAAKALQDTMRAFKQRAMDDVEAFVALSAERYDVKLGGIKGNVTLMSFDGKYKVQMAISEYLTFDEGLQAAKKLIDECLTDWTSGSRSEVRTIVMDAFQVDKEGKINTGRILGLRRLSINDPRWLKAMAAIADSIQVMGSKSYIRIYERVGADGRYNQIALDIASL